CVTYAKIHNGFLISVFFVLKSEFKFPFLIKWGAKPNRWGAKPNSPASNSHNAAILTPPGMGHMIPSLELAKRLVTHQIVPKVTIFLASIKTSVPSKAETQLLQSATNDNLFQIIHLPPLDMTNLVGPDATIETQVYPVGLIVREEIRRQDGSDVFEWLDKQEEESEGGLRVKVCTTIYKQLLGHISSQCGTLTESVVYISLGSGYRMSQEQIKEMALGLELSGKTFVWSLRTHAATKAGDAIANYFTAGKETEAETGGGVSKSEELNSLPDEFYRIQTRGIVLRDWAPQLDILKHPSVGGFVSHCGWNSVMESVSCGVPIVGWPLYAEQRMNAAMLAEEIGIAVRLELPLSTNVVGREELAKAIRKVMDEEDEEGCEMRKKVKELKEAAKRAWSEDGSSYLALSRISQANGAL
ncbi:UDP-glycosyltransferase 72D1-like, partial [Lotus japonicus]|uniref:UDP-glycosyltransferase 72D1-like n=1 Tax=Lotus japonicus TaxID=34305 RepID=UPI00258AB536